MIEDFTSLSHGLHVDADICVIGAGAAGLLIARELVGERAQVILIESGGFAADAAIQRLSEGKVYNRSFRGLQAGRSRVFGGTTTLWGGQCITLDPIDFEPRSWVPSSGWPISEETLTPFYRKAKRRLGILGDESDQPAWRRFGLDGLAFDPAILRTTHGVFIRHANLGARFRRDLQRAANVRVLLRANVTRLMTDPSGSRIEGAELRSLEGKTGKISARFFVLCTGGIENARLLLLSDQTSANGLGNRYGLVGRYFQDHPVGRCGVIETDQPRVLQDHYNMLYGKTANYFPKLALSEVMQRREQVLNCVGRLEYEFEPNSGMQAIRDILAAARDGKLPDRLMAKLFYMGRGTPSIAYNAWRLFARGLSPAPTPRRIYLEAFSEQAPDPDSRVMLSDQIDALGLRKARIDWRLNELSGRTLRVFARSVQGEFHRLGLGRVILPEWLEGSAERDAPLVDNYHHAGATRMGRTASQGVVDTECQVFGVNGLYIAGSSVFPTSGAANPTLTIAALALRLADRLKTELSRGAAASELMTDRPRRVARGP